MNYHTLPLLALAALAASCATDRDTYVRGSYLRVEADDDFGALDQIGADAANGVEVQVLAPLKWDENLYLAVGAGYAASSSNFVGFDVEAERTAISVGLEQRLPLDERFHVFAQAGLMRNEVELDVGGVVGEEDEVGLYIALGAAANLGGSLDAVLAWRPIEPELDDGLGGDIDTTSILLGLQVAF